MANILLVGKGPPERGGIPTYLTQIVEAHWDDHDIRVLNLTHAGEREGGQLTIGNVMRTLRDVTAVARERDVDVVHVHSALAPLSTLIRAAGLCGAARLRGRRVLLHAHGGRLVGWAHDPRRKRLLRWAVCSADRVLVVSEGLRATMEAAGVSRPVELLANGVDTQRFVPPAGGEGNDPPVILFVGHLSERKGVGDLLAASRMLEDRGVGHRLVLAGGVPDEGASGPDPWIGAPPSATFLGPIDPAEMPDLYRRCDLFCLPSWWEATPLSVLEAMATGLPVVATDVGDVAAMLGPAGVVVPTRDPTLLADALESVIIDGRRRAELGRLARGAALEHHDLTAVHRRLDEVYAMTTDHHES